MTPTRCAPLSRLALVGVAIALLPVSVANADPDPAPPPVSPGVTGVLNDWQKSVCEAGSFTQDDPAIAARDWPGAVRAGTCASAVNPGLTNGLWISQWTANSDMTSALQRNFMALFASAVSDQTAIITFAVASPEARKSLEPLTKFGFTINPVPPLA
ncbi:hypothetical protein [Mycolicibacterium llatzerense]|uniref:Uncharacterized protein n=1 Tax=Mycolicibacterium llatzerense TaxID=280871 RepID=A0A0D1LNV7_9MYCO|nr:hypothetical protein [Mycolicibacterium llatzerense]KIU17696.1 hypothetical protein TL10_07235 [Mycolicibacterium llatzerense]